MGQKYITRKDMTDFAESIREPYSHHWAWFDTLVASAAVRNGAPVAAAAKVSEGDATTYVRAVNALIRGGYMTAELYRSLSMMVSSMNVCEPPELVGDRDEIGFESALIAHLETIASEGDQP